MKRYYLSLIVSIALKVQPDLAASVMDDFVKIFTFKDEGVVYLGSPLEMLVRNIGLFDDDVERIPLRDACQALQRAWPRQHGSCSLLSNLSDYQILIGNTILSRLRQVVVNEDVCPDAIIAHSSFFPSVIMTLAAAKKVHAKHAVNKMYLIYSNDASKVKSAPDITVQECNGICARLGLELRPLEDEDRLMNGKEITSYLLPGFGKSMPSEINFLEEEAVDRFVRSLKTPTKFAVCAPPHQLESYMLKLNCHSDRNFNFQVVSGVSCDEYPWLENYYPTLTEHKKYVFGCGTFFKLMRVMRKYLEKQDLGGSASWRRKKLGF